LSPAWKEAILNGKIIIGMNQHQVIASIGHPQKRNKTTGNWGISEQWIYEWKWKYAYVYFENGILTSWQSQ